jgi:hypothetical protein
VDGEGERHPETLDAMMNGRAARSPEPKSRNLRLNIVPSVVNAAV